MSRWNDKAEAFAEMLRDQSIPDTATRLLEGVEVTVNRKEDLLGQVNEQAGKADSKGCVIVKHLGGKNADRKSARLRMGGRYSISLWCMEAVYSGLPPDDLAEKIGEALHGWTAAGDVLQSHRLEVDSINIIPAGNGFLVYEIIAEIARV